MEPTVSGTSASQSQDSAGQESQTKNSQAPLIKRKSGLYKEFYRETHKFTTEEQLQIIRWIAQYKSLGDIVKLTKDTFKKSISKCQITQYKNAEKWQPVIQKDRERYASELFKVELANERRRIEELEDNYWRLKKMGKYRDAILALHEIYEQLKKPDALIQNNYQFNVYKEMSEEEFDKRELELLQKRKLLKEEMDVISHSEIEGKEA